MVVVGVIAAFGLGGFTGRWKWRGRSPHPTGGGVTMWGGALWGGRARSPLRAAITNHCHNQIIGRRQWGGIGPQPKPQLSSRPLRWGVGQTRQWPSDLSLQGFKTGSPIRPLKAGGRPGGLKF